MAKQTFTTGQVLSAAQMTSLQQTAMLGGDTTAKTVSYTLVAADAGTTVAMSNAGATTITVNTALFAAGDIVTIQNRGAGTCTVTAGTATVSTSGSLALAQNQGGVLYFTSASASIFFQFSTGGSSAGLTSLASGTLSGASVVLSSISGSYVHLQLAISNFQPATAEASFYVRANGDSGANRYAAVTAGSAPYTFNSTGWQVSAGQLNSANNGTIIIDLFNYTKTTGYKLGSGIAIVTNTANGDQYLNSTLVYNQAPAITSLTMLPSSGNFTGGTYTLYGVK
jgi:hypothetical protein